MKRFLLVMALLIIGTQMAFAAQSAFEQTLVPFLDPADTSTRDTYGYQWVDNDNGGPTPYNWIDITTIGTQVQGLADDNNVGAFNLGWSFQYYWYPVTRLWIGSNGYISFSSNTNFAHPFSNIPNTRQPNDLVAVLTGDLDFTASANARCYYYSNNVDTFIVSWISVPQFGLPDSVHTFQLILAGRDSSLTFQYGVNHGNFAESGNLADVIGIENVVGRVGLQYLYNNAPTSRLWHNGLAIKFKQVRNPNFNFSDFGVVDVLHEGSGADFVTLNQPYTVRALMRNFGTQTEDSLIATCVIRKLPGNTIIYNHVDSLGTLNSLGEVWAEFVPDFVPDSVKTYKVTVTSGMPHDGNTTNNNKTAGLIGFTLPSDLKYDDGVAETGRSWNGDFSGFGNEFVVPVPVLLSSASFYVNATAAPGDAIVWVLRDNANGLPDLENILFSDTISVEADFTGWKTVSLTGRNLNFLANQRFYVVGIHVTQSTFDFGMDKTLTNPLSNRGWEFTGGLAPDRERDSSNVMIKVNASLGTGIEEEIMPKSFSLSQNYPNPFNAQTNINFSLSKASDVVISIYSITGQLVEKIKGFYPAGDNVVTWNAANKASGVYFYRMNVGNNVEVKKMVLVK